ncbi:hypothetical protein KWH45_17180 [Xanthomonas campestris pv. mirabilis]|uniref:hypothetical protein n=1 Tax=Xanthomonas euvesicatoria TaxID=456327 RepID=UPI001C490A40|nr:hypothetical protein [Xanthomonas euvesicatoria]MBV6855145.1 hypothetical protein [Xanthomonas campestris pv. mirabilis]
MDRKQFGKAFLRLTKQSAIPLVLSLSYSTWVYASKQNATLVEATSSFAAAFFFFMWLAGQFLRASKQIADQDNFDRLSAGIDDIRASVEDLRANRTAPSGAGTAPSGASTAPPLSGPAMGFLTQARNLVESGHVLAGLLQAGLVFEQAVHAKAQRIGLYHGKPHNKLRNVPALLRAIEDQLGPSAKRELQLLWRLRSQIVHADPEAATSLQNQPELLNFFETGVALLGLERDPS